LPYINAIVLTDAEGKLINFSRSWPVPNVIRPEQDPTEAFKSDPQLNTFVGIPLRSPVTGNWVIPISRKFTGPDGKFLGVVIGVIEAQKFEEYFKAITTASDQSILLFRRDGKMLVRYPRLDAVVGQPLPRSGLFENQRPKFDNGTFRQNGAIDGKDRLISARSLIHYPIMVVVTTSVADTLANWRRGAITMTGAFAGSSQRSTCSRLDCAIETQPAVALPVLTCRKIALPLCGTTGETLKLMTAA